MDPKPTKKYAIQIKRLRTKMGLTQINLAERLGVSFPTVNRWKNVRTMPSQFSWNRLLELANETDPDCRTVKRTIRGTVESTGVRIRHAQIMEVAEI